MSEAHARDRAGPTIRAGLGLAASGAADWLRLAASPTFAIMALLTAAGGEPQLLCSAAHLASPAGGMVTMYLLMSAFHSRPWLEHIAGGGRAL